MLLDNQFSVVVEPGVQFDQYVSQAYTDIAIDAELVRFVGEDVEIDSHPLPAATGIGLQQHFEFLVKLFISGQLKAKSGAVDLPHVGDVQIKGSSDSLTERIAELQSCGLSAPKTLSNSFGSKARLSLQRATVRLSPVTKTGRGPTATVSLLSDR